VFINVFNYFRINGRLVCGNLVHCMMGTGKVVRGNPVQYLMGMKKRLVRGNPVHYLMGTRRVI
jgi:hypothetical protein